MTFEEQKEKLKNIQKANEETKANWFPLILLIIFMGTWTYLICKAIFK